MDEDPRKITPSKRKISLFDIICKPQILHFSLLLPLIEYNITHKKYILKILQALEHV